MLQIVVNPSGDFGKKIRDLLMSPKTYMLNELMNETPASSANPMVHMHMCGRKIYLLLLYIDTYTVINFFIKICSFV